MKSFMLSLIIFIVPTLALAGEAAVPSDSYAQAACTRYSSFVPHVVQYINKGVPVSRVLAAIDSEVKDKVDASNLKSIALYTFRRVPYLSNTEIQDEITYSVMNRVYIECYSKAMKNGQ